MAARFDVAARLAEGRPAVEHTQTYVRACHVLGYQHPDLTKYGSQVCDWYETEAGLDLRVLDDDSAELAAAVNAIEEALHLQRAQLAELAVAWRGQGADSAMWFLQRHCEAAAVVTVHARAAAEGCAALRDNLWEMVDGKVAAAIAIDDRTLGERPAWLAAAHTVMAGGGDRSVAEGLVRQQVNLYVDNDIRTDWVAAMRSSVASVTASYDLTIHALMSAPEVCFEAPGELGPSWQSVSYEPLDRTLTARTLPEMPLLTGTVPAMPAAVSASLPPTTAAPHTLPVGAPEDLSPVPAELAAPLGDAAGLSAGAGNLGGPGGLAGSIGGVVGKIADSIGGLLNSLTDGLADLPGSGDPVPDGALGVDDPLVGEAGDDVTDDGPDDMGVPPTCGGAAEPADAACDRLGENAPAADDATDAAQQATVPPMDTPPPAGASPDASPPDDPTALALPPEGATPGEIAADELPQAGR